MEWDAPAVVLAAAAHGESSLLVTALTEAHGAHRGLVRGGASRRQAASWLPGNVLQLRWVGRLSEQLGTFTGELVHATAALAMDDRLALAVLSSACATAEGALHDREPHPALFGGLVALLAGLSDPARSLTALARWELRMLAELGYGLDLSRCALSGGTEGLAWVSPRTGRAVSEDAAGEWRSRLLPLPRFLIAGGENEPPAPEAWRDALRLTGHFLARDAFGQHGRALPPARERLADMVAALSASK